MTWLWSLFLDWRFLVLGLMVSCFWTDSFLFLDWWFLVVRLMFSCSWVNVDAVHEPSGWKWHPGLVNQRDTVTETRGKKKGCSHWEKHRMMHHKTSQNFCPKFWMNMYRWYIVSFYPLPSFLLSYRFFIIRNVHQTFYSNYGVMFRNIALFSEHKLNLHMILGLSKE